MSLFFPSLSSPTKVCHRNGVWFFVEKELYAATLMSFLLFRKHISIPINMHTLRGTHSVGVVLSTCLTTMQTLNWMGSKLAEKRNLQFYIIWESFCDFETRSRASKLHVLQSSVGVDNCAEFARLHLINQCQRKRQR